jgi:hypothetical protein
MALSVFQGCKDYTNCSVEEYRQERREIVLRLVSAIDSFSIRYEGLGYVIADVPVREFRNDSLGDTVICRFFGIEEWYEGRRHANSVTVEKAGIRISHQPLPADRVDYQDSALGILVLQKIACDPIAPVFNADSIHIEKAGAKRVVFDTLSRRE